MNTTINDDDKRHEDIKYVSLDKSENGYTSGIISLDIPPSKKKDNSIIESRMLTNNRLTKSRISNMNIIKDDGTIITGYSIAHPKRNKDFHSLFKEISQNEHLVNNYSCALQKDILIQGMMFVSLYHICFHSNIFGWVTNFVIPFSDIIEIEKKMTAYVIPNAIQITTKDARYFFASFLSRDSVYELLMKIRNYNNDQYSRGSDSDTESTKSTKSTVSDKKGSDSEVHSHNGMVCDCLKNNQHFNNLILDTKFKGSVEKIYNLLYTSGFSAEFLREKHTDVNIGEWTKDDDGKLIRLSNYIRRLNKTTSPKTAKCYLKDEVLHQDFDKYVTIMTSVNTPDVPSGGTFKVKIRTCIMWADSDTTRIIITSTVKFSRYSLFKSIIEESSLEGQLIHYKELETAIHRYISQNLTEFDSESASVLSEKLEDDAKKFDDDIQDLIIKEEEKIILPNDDDKTRNKLRIPSIETIVIITLLLTLIFNVYVLTSIRNVSAKIELIEGQNEAGNKEVNIKFSKIYPLNKLLNELKR